MSEFIYTPKSGSRVFAARLGFNRLAVVTWRNGSHHVLGTATKVVFEAASRAWREAARNVLAAAAPPFDMIAWDVQGELHVRMAGNPRAQASLLAVLRETARHTDGPTGDLTGQLVVSQEWMPMWTYLHPAARLGAEPNHDPALIGQVTAEEPAVTLEPDPTREGETRWVVRWGDDVAAAGTLGAPVVNGQPYSIGQDGFPQPCGARQDTFLASPLRYGQAVSA